MRICHLVPGSGGTFYCQNCLRDYALVRALRREGHDVVMLPLYLPPFRDDIDTDSKAPVFFGGINVYLQQHFAIFRRTPRWVDRMFDTPWMLKIAAARESSTNAASLGPMTLSMLEGHGGRQRKEVDRLVAWLQGHEKPDVIHISNALLLGLAPEIKRALDVPIVCTLQDEEPWVDAMPAPHKQLCWKAISGHAAHVDTFIATSAWYADRMSARMNTARERISVVYLGVETDEFVPMDLRFDPPTIGFLSRLSEAQGFGILVDAFIELKQEPALKDLRLRATGGYTTADRPFIETVRAELGRYGFEDSVDLLSDFQKADRREFLHTVSAVCIPVPHGEAFGIQLIEAMASGVPVVQPRVGAYPEIIEATGGGILYDPEKSDAMVDALRSLLQDPEHARALGKRGRAAVLKRFDIDREARDILNVYATVLKS
jgi:glycosyltransferase involved in cell wall biosynthesis